MKKGLLLLVVILGGALIGTGFDTLTGAEVGLEALTQFQRVSHNVLTEIHGALIGLVIVKMIG